MKLNDLVNEVVKIENYIFGISTALAVLMLTVAGLYIILDRDVSMHKRSERLAFVRSILVGYGIILGANLLVGVLVTAMGGVLAHNGTPIPAAPAPVRHQESDLVHWSCPLLPNGHDFCKDFADDVNSYFHFVQDLLAVVITVPVNFTSELDGIQTLAGLFRVIAVLMLAIMVMIGGFQMMIGRATGIDYTPPGEFIPRVVAAALASYFSMLICQTLIDLTNVIANAELTFTVHFVLKKGADAIAVFSTFLLLFGAQMAAIPFVKILIIILLALILILILKGCARIALINLLIVVAPLAIILWILPQTRKWAAFWFTLFTTTLAEVILEDLVFCVTLVILFSDSVQTGDDLLRIIIAISALLLMTRISHLLSRMGGAGPHNNLAGAAFGAALTIGRAALIMNGLGAIAGRMGLNPFGGRGNPPSSRGASNPRLLGPGGGTRQGDTPSSPVGPNPGARVVTGTLVNPVSPNQGGTRQGGNTGGPGSLRLGPGPDPDHGHGRLRLGPGSLQTDPDEFR